MANFILKKNEIQSFPFEECASLNKLDLEQWAAEHNLTAFNSWMLPQIQAHYGSFKAVRALGSDQYDTMALLKDNISKTDPWELGLWRICTQAKRGALVKSQTFTPEYSALVPLILSGLKKFKNIRYSEWTVEGLQHIMGSDLYEAATYKVPELSKEELLEIRQTGLTVMSGNSAGTQKKATSTWKLTGIKNTALGEAPAFATTMLSQIWVAHPSIRNNLMILDPMDWDNMPSPLIETAVISAPKSQELLTEIPW